jgi:hypothetical protein
MLKGTITVRDGVVVKLQTEGHDPALLGGGALSLILKDLKEHGWEPDGDLPPYTIEGEYIISVVKS